MIVGPHNHWPREEKNHSTSREERIKEKSPFNAYPSERHPKDAYLYGTEVPTALTPTEHTFLPKLDAMTIVTYDSLVVDSQLINITTNHSP